MVFKIVKYGNPILEREGQNVANFNTPELDLFIADLFETMYASKGVGLAAPQVGVSQKLTVIDCGRGDDEEPHPIVLINPEVIHKEGKQAGEEGCLSIPGFREDVKRAKAVIVRAQNAQGEFFEISGDDLLARCMQHEIDHLYGKLFLSYLSPLKRDVIKRRIRKLMKNGEWE